MPAPRGTSQKSVVSFNAGEWSPFLDARVDSKKYDSACRELTNCTILPYGGVERRGGMKYIATTKDNGTRKSRLIGYDFSTTTSYVFELGQGYMRFFSNGAPVINTTIDDVLTGTPPWLEAELFEVQFVQVNDIMYFTHPNHPVQKLSRTSANTFTLEEVVFDEPAFLDVNITNTTITPSVTTGSGTLTASANTFTSDHVGSYWKITHPRQATQTSIALTGSGTSSTLNVIDTWNFRTTGSWSGTVQVQELNTSTGSWENVVEYTSNDGDRNVDFEDDQLVEAQFRINYTLAGSPESATTPQAYLEVLNTERSGIVKITGYNSPTSVNMTVIDTLENTNATDNWNEGAWSAEQGYPRSVAIFEQRICYGGTKNRPQTVWGSKTDDFEDFEIGTTDSDAFSYTLASNEQNSIQWMSGQQKLLIGTIGAEWTMGGDAEKPLTPSNVAVFRQSTYGSDFIQGFMVSDTVLYVQRNGRKVRELVESETSVTAKYVSPDMTIFAEHITDGGIIQADFTQQPNNIYWAVTGEGKLIGMTYERDQDVIGWFKHETNGTIESVATIYGGLNDEIWVLLNALLTETLSDTLRDLTPL